MTDHHHPDAPRPEAPTRKQLRCLRALANATGRTFTYPKTKAEASDQIDRLKRRQRATRGERQAEREHASNATDATYATRVRDHETTGYGITARWA